jgi:hypothetical protein
MSLILVWIQTYFQEAKFSKQTAGTFQEVPSERGNNLKGRKFVRIICRVKMIPIVIGIDFLFLFCQEKRKVRIFLELNCTGYFWKIRE